MNICASVVETGAAEAMAVMAQAAEWADLFELRLDYLAEDELDARVWASPKPVVLTCRPEEQGGKSGAGDDKRLSLIRNFMSLSPAYADIELYLVEKLFKQTPGWLGQAELIASAHLFDGTPSSDDLHHLLERACSTPADVIKLVTWAHGVDDNLRVLALYAAAREMQRPLIAFCMGPLGRLSRVAAPLLGSPWTYAPARGGVPSAPGQIEGPELKRVMDILRS